MELISGSYDGATLKSFADRLTTDEMLSALETLQKSVATMKDTKNPKLSAELCIVSMCESAAGDSVAELKARISRLEATVQNGVPVRTAAPAAVSAPTAPIREQERPPIDEYEELYPPQPSYRDEPEYEELDPMDYAEEQPEDSFLQRSDKAAPPEPVKPVVPDISDAELWAKVCEKAKPTLPVDTHIHLGDSNTIKAYMANGVLHLNVKPGFIFGRFNKPEIVAKISAAATAVRGVQTNVLVSEMKAEEPKAASRSIEDLKKFKEVRFI
jgi:DNA polymerase III gamma/tau subunit